MLERSKCAFTWIVHFVFFWRAALSFAAFIMSVMICPRGLGVFSKVLMVWESPPGFFIQSSSPAQLLTAASKQYHPWSCFQACFHLVLPSADGSRHLKKCDISQYHECQEYDPSLSLLDAEWAYLSVRFVFPWRWCAAIVRQLVLVRQADVREPCKMIPESQ